MSRSLPPSSPAAVVQTGKRTFLQELVGLATALGFAGAATPAMAGFQPPRRPGMEGKRFGMLVDLRKCIG